MKLTYPGPHEAVILPDGRKVERDKSTDIADEATAASLVAQGWVPEAVKADKAAKKSTTTAAPAIPKE